MYFFLRFLFDKKVLCYGFKIPWTEAFHNSCINVVRIFVFSFFTAISKEDPDRNRTSRDALPSKLQFNGYSEEFLDRIEPNGNIPCANDEHLSRYGTSYVCLKVLRRGSIFSVTDKWSFYAYFHNTTSVHCDLSIVIDADKVTVLFLIIDN